MDALEDGASDQDDVQYVGEQNSKSSKKGGRPRDSVREHFTDTGAKDSIKKRAPCKCNYCSQQFTASTAEVATLRDHILHKCKHAPAAARQQLLQQQAQKIDPAAASASAALLAAGGSKRRRSSSGGSSSVQLLDRRSEGCLRRVGLRRTGGPGWKGRKCPNLGLGWKLRVLLMLVQ